MNPFATRSAVLSVAAIVAAACSSQPALGPPDADASGVVDAMDGGDVDAAPPTEDQACAAYAKLRCDRVAQCSPFDLQST
jgi:hypothetical protein